MEENKHAAKRPSLLGLSDDELRSKIAQLRLLVRVGNALSAEKNRDRLVELILLEAKQLCNADGGTLYIRESEGLRNPADVLRFAIVRNDSLGISQGGESGDPVNVPPIRMFDAETGAPNLHNVASASANMKQSFNIPDAYFADGFDFSGTKRFDEGNSYRSRSFLTVPLVNNEDYVIGVLQLINAIDPVTGQVIPFSEEQQSLVETLTGQAALALDNQLLFDGQKQLLEAFIKMIASAIDAKSPYTGAHCERVPILTEMLTRSLCDEKEGPYGEFNLTDEEWYELKIAAWLHDCGKVTTPVHVMDKATKLETIFDRIALVRTRFEVLRREAEIAYYKRLAAGGDKETALANYQRELEALDDDLRFLEKVNVGGEFLGDKDKDRIRRIGKRRYQEGGAPRTLLSDEELKNLLVARGTLTQEERLIINGHMVHTIRMLESLPFPRNQRRVPEYAGGHHEKMDGTGYPRGLYASDMSIPARVMAIADVFEALTAADRPYKKGKKLSETMAIMAKMKRFNHLDPTLLDHFVRSGVYKEYAKRFLDPTQIDEVDEAAILTIDPEPFELPADEVREQRWVGFRPEYRFADSQHPEAPDAPNQDPTTVV